ncbi:hypothetical protein ACUW9G_001456, partial [Staphylococcus schleiferi]
HLWYPFIQAYDLSSLLSYESKPNTQTRKTFIANYFFKIPRDSSVFKSVKTTF